MKKLDPRLWTLVADVEKVALGAGSAPPAAAPCIDAEVEVVIWFTGSVDDLVAAGLKLEWRDRNDRGFLYATGWIAPSRLTEVAAIPHVVTVEPPNMMTPELSDSVPAIGIKALRQAHADATGTGIVVAIIGAQLDTVGHVLGHAERGDEVRLDGRQDRRAVLILGDLDDGGAVASVIRS